MNARRFLLALAAILAAAATARAAHPTVTLLDEDRKSVLETGRPVSATQTCAHCHDTEFIAQHSTHAGALCLADPAGLAPASERPQRQSVSMNCFLCHIAAPDNEARLAELWAGRAEWAATATLAKTGLARRTDEGWTYPRDAFPADGRVKAGTLSLAPPKSEQCGLCHGQVYRGEAPLELKLSLGQSSTAAKGEVFSPQRISASAANIAGKEGLSRPWDVHAERLLECASCHYAGNNPAMTAPAAAAAPKHLTFEPRRLSIREFLKRPDHRLAGDPASPAAAHCPGGSMRGPAGGPAGGGAGSCVDCHNASATHGWLPYREAHFARLSCEACHIPQSYAPAVAEMDWTLPRAGDEPRVVWRGIDGGHPSATATVRGFRPALLPRKDSDGQMRLAPYNLVAQWYWTAGGKSPQRVSMATLRKALGKAEEGGNEAILDAPEKIEAVKQRLAAAGVESPRIEAELQARAIHHGVAPAKWATRRCETCHAADSRLSEPFVLAAHMPGGVAPKNAVGSPAAMGGRVVALRDGSARYEPNLDGASIYVLGHSRWWWVDLLGGVAVAAVIGVAAVHAGARIVCRRKCRGQEPKGENS